MKRALKVGVLSLLAVLAAVLLLSALLLGSQGGSRWLLAQMPGLQAENFSGRLGGQWQAERLRWQQGDSMAVIDNAVFAWSPSCLLRLTLCIERLQAERIDLHLAQTPAASDKPFALTDIDLPLALQLGRVDIGSLQIDGAEQLRSLQLDAHWNASGLQIDRLRAQRENLELVMHGTLQAQGNWPLNLSGTLQLPAVEQQPWQVALQVSGNLRQSVLLKASSSGYLNGQLVAETQPLLDNLPARAQLRVDDFKASAELPDTLRLQNLQLDAQGDLANGYQLNGTAELPAEGGAVSLALDGLAYAEGAHIAGLNLSAGPEQHLRLNAQMDWRQGFSADGHFQWQDFPWRRLYPAIEQPPVELRQLSADLSYVDGDYLGNFVAELDGPAGAFSVTSPVSGDLQQLHLPELKMRASQGQADGRLTLGFADGIRWDAQLDLNDFNPAYWLAELPGTLAGPLSSQGELRDQKLALSAAFDIAGRLRGHPALFQAQVRGGAEQWALDGLELRLGENRVHGSAATAGQLRGQVHLALMKLGQLWPSLEGQLNGQLDLRGSLQAPAGQLSLRGQRLAFAASRLQNLQLDASLDAAQQAQLQLDATGIAIDDRQVGRLSASAQGDRQRQQLRLKLDGSSLQAALAVNGELQQGVWRGRLGRGELHSGGQTWRLQQAATLVRQADGQLDLGAHCWRAGAASLCAADQRLLPEPKLRYRLANFPLDSLAPWFPEDFAWQGQLNAELQLDLPAAGPSGQIVVDAGSGVWRIREQGQWLDFPYDQLRLNTQLRPERVDTDLQLSGPELGSLMLQAQLDPRPVDKPLTGTFRLQGVELAMARPFMPMVEHLAGQLNGQGSLAGSLNAPLVDGRLQLSDGEIAGAELPLSFEALNLQARIAGESLRLDGAWRSGEQGSGRLDGELAWRDGLVGELRIGGSRLPVTVEPYTDLEVASDLRVQIADQQVAVAGKLAIPRGSILIRQLPPSTVKVSPDAQVVGQTQTERQSLPIKMDVEVEVGQERLSFSGFGLSADLAGRMKIGDNLDARGELNLNNGRYRAYGQRLTIRRARLLFAGPIDQPFLDVEAIRQVDEVTVGLRLTGNAEQPQTEVFSEPAMSQEQALSYLVLGRPLGQSAEDNNMLAQAALAMGLAGSAPLSNRVADVLGIGNFQLDTEGSGAATSVVASGELSERLSLRYGVGVFEPASTVALRYELSKRLYLEAASGLASSLDVFYRRDF